MPINNQQQVRGLVLPGEHPAVDGVEYICGNILDPESLFPLFRRDGAEEVIVIHTAGTVDVSGESFPQFATGSP